MPNTKTTKTTKAPSTGRADERATRMHNREVRALESASRWLRRRGAARENKETQRAYVTAATAIHKLAKAS